MQEKEQPKKGQPGTERTGEQRTGQRTGSQAAGEREGTEGVGGKESSGQAKGTSQEDLLKEQQLSYERQKEGRGWHELPPGESSGTTPLEKSPSTQEQGGRREGQGTPGAAKAEHEGQAQRKEGKEGTEGSKGREGREGKGQEEQEGAQARRGERRT